MRDGGVVGLRDPAGGRENRGQIRKNRARAPGGRPSDEAPETHDAPLRLEPHVCRHCFGRLVSAPAPGGARSYVCSNCGAAARGDAPDVLCACGLKLRNHGPGPRLVDAGLRCQPNPNPRPDFPSLFVAAEARP